MKYIIAIIFNFLIGVNTTFAATATRFAKDKGAEVKSGLTNQIAEFINSIFMQIPFWIMATIILFVSFLLANIAKSTVIDRISQKVDDESEEIQILAGRMTYTGVVLLGITVALKTAGIDLTSIMAAVAFGIGFALKDLIMNFLSGVLILISRQFTIGDIIEVDGAIGIVVSIQSRATIMKAFDGTRIIVPNKELFMNKVISYTSNPMRRIELVIGVDYTSDLRFVSKLVLDTVIQHPQILRQPAAAVVMDEFGDSSINFKLRFWVEANAPWIAIRSDLVIMIKEMFDKHNISIPFPIRTMDQRDEKILLGFAHENHKKLEKGFKTDKVKAPSLTNKTAISNQAPVNTTAIPVTAIQKPNNTEPSKPIIANTAKTEAKVETSIISSSHIPSASKVVRQADKPSANQPGAMFLQKVNVSEEELKNKKTTNVAPVKAAPVKAAPISAAPISAAPISAAPVNVAPVKAAPINVAPINVAPVNVAPVNTVPTKNSGQPPSPTL